MKMQFIQQAIRWWKKN